MAVSKRRSAKWKSGFLVGLSDGRLDAALQRPPADFLLDHQGEPDQWGRGYAQGYEEGYNQGLQDMQHQD